MCFKTVHGGVHSYKTFWSLAGSLAQYASVYKNTLVRSLLARLVKDCPSDWKVNAPLGQARIFLANNKLACLTLENKRT